MEEHKGIVVAGSVLVDKINTISAYPKSGELTQIHEVSMAVGGCVPNVAIDLKKIDTSLPVWSVGRIGEDAEGKYLTQILQENGVDTRYLSVTKDKTSFTEVMSIPGGQRTFFCHAGASAKFGVGDIPWDLKPVLLHLGYFLLLEKVDCGDGLKILQNAKAKGIHTSIDLVSENSDRYSLVKPCLPYTDYLIINELEAGMLCGMEPTNNNLQAIAEALRAMGVQEKVIIHKPDCAVCLSDSGYTMLPSYALPEGYIKGTTGAGDAFCAGALYGIYQNWTDREILSFASSAAVMALGSADATSGLREKEKIDTFCSHFQRREI